MSKKSDNFYFKNFVACAEYGEEASQNAPQELKRV